MKKQAPMMRRKLWIASGAAVVVVMSGLLVYGSYISAQYQMEALRTTAHVQWVHLDRVVRRKAKLAPELAAAVGSKKVLSQQERTALEELARASKALLQAHNPKDVIPASHALEESFDGVLAAARSHPAEKTDAKLQAVEERLRRLQDRVEQNRRRYNGSLRNYNVFLAEFPNNLWAKIAGFEKDHRFFPGESGQKQGL